MTLISRRGFCGAFGALAGWPAAAKPGKPVLPPAGPLDEAVLPAGTRRMLAGIRSAAQSGAIQSLRAPIERNEVPPLFERGAPTPAIETLKRRSADGEGQEMLQILLRVLGAGCAPLSSGAAPTQYLWPYFANIPFGKRSPAAQAAGWSLVRVADIGLSAMAGEPLLHRVIIGADGTWQVFAVL